MADRRVRFRSKHGNLVLSEPFSLSINEGGRFFTFFSRPSAGIIFRIYLFGLVLSLTTFSNDGLHLLPKETLPIVYQPTR